MKTFTKEQVGDLFNQVLRGEISFYRMVEILNERVSERVSEAADIPEELKKGDLAIFWDDDTECAALRFYEQSNWSGARFQHEDSFGFNWANAVKFESKEQYEKLLKGEI